MTPNVLFYSSLIVVHFILLFRPSACGAIATQCYGYGNCNLVSNHFPNLDTIENTIRSWSLDSIWISHISFQNLITASTCATTNSSAKMFSTMEV